MKNKSRQVAYDAIESTLIEMWKSGLVLRSSNPDTRSGEYYFALPSYVDRAKELKPDIGPYISYEEFQSQLN